MVKVLPGDSIIGKRLVCKADVLLLEANLQFSLGIGLGQAQDLSVQLLEALLGEDSTLIHAENMRSLQLTVDNTVSHDFLHHLLLRAISVSLTHEVGVLNLGVRSTLRVVFA